VPCGVVRCQMGASAIGGAEIRKKEPIIDIEWPNAARRHVLERAKARIRQCTVKHKDPAQFYRTSFSLRCKGTVQIDSAFADATGDGKAGDDQTAWRPDVWTKPRSSVSASPASQPVSDRMTDNDHTAGAAEA
jgi:hypothetical protein